MTHEELGEALCEDAGESTWSRSYDLTFQSSGSTVRVVIQITAHGDGATREAALAKLRGVLANLKL